MFKHILVPTDGSALSFKALDLAVTLASTTDTQITALHVSPNYPTSLSGDGYMVSPITPKDWDISIEKQLAHIRSELEKHAGAKSVAVTFASTSVDQPYVGIIEFARREKCDLIVMASHGRRGISALLLGSETTKVLTHCKLPVLVCR
jgi:nucleotide-binding universal stress UspA family protein